MTITEAIEKLRARLFNGEEIRDAEVSALLDVVEAADTAVNEYGLCNSLDALEDALTALAARATLRALGLGE
ncbi:MAG: hypothetical protein GY953_29890 [bacterium]|nr:hypothetical protein [bacterium]